jgi:Glucodextranase, domain B
MRRTALIQTFTKTAIGISFVSILGYGAFAARGYFSGPVITISEPTQYTVTENGALTISGKVERTEFVSMNGRTIFTTPAGIFSERMLLTPGNNTFVIEATDTFGTRHENRITVSFAPHEAGSISDTSQPVLVLLK